jgi:ParB family chromosome partitioning protein
MPTKTKTPKRDLRTVPIADLTTGLNVRTNAEPDRDLIASVKANGVLQPPTVEPTGDGKYRIVFGHRRANAAAAAGYTELEVLVVDAELAEELRLTEQLVENEQRQQLTEAERVGGYRQLELLSVSPADIAKRLGAPAAQVKKTLAVAQSSAAVEVLGEHAISLDQAAVIVEFEDSDEDVAALRQAAKDRQFDHVASRIRDRRAKEAVIAAKEQELAAAGVTVLGEKPATVGYSGTPADPVALIEHPHGYIQNPVYADEAGTKSVKPAAHKTCPGRAVFVDAEWNRTDKGNEYFPVVIEYCLDWKANGHHRTSTGKPAKKALEDMTPAELEAAEKEKAERRRVIQNNKDWPLATEVRRTWIKDSLLQQKKLPADSDLIPALWASSNLPKESYNVGLETVKNWLDISGDEWSSGAKIRRHLITGNENTATRTMLAIALSAVEDQLGDKDAWRSQASRGLGLYLQVLASWGYDPSVLELELIAEHKKAKK